MCLFCVVCVLISFLLPLLVLVLVPLFSALAAAAPAVASPASAAVVVAAAAAAVAAATVDAVFAAAVVDVANRSVFLLLLLLRPLLLFLLLLLSAPVVYRGDFARLLSSWPMFSAFLYFLAMSFTIPVLPKVVNEMLTGSKAVRTAIFYVLHSRHAKVVRRSRVRPAPVCSLSEVMPSKGNPTVLLPDKTNDHPTASASACPQQ